MAISTVISGSKTPELIGANPQQYSTDYDAIRMGREANQNRLAVQNLANLGEKNRMLRFNTVFPWLQNQITGLQGQLTSSVGGQSGQGPPISAGPLVNPAMQQQQINAMRARSGMLQQTQAATNAREAAARGVGASSPLVMAMNNAGRAASLADMTAGERDIRLGNAQANAQHLLQAQQAREAQYANRMGEDIERRRTVLGMFPQLLNSISGLV